MGDRFENTAIIETPDLDDYIRLVTKEGGTRRALASELAKKIVEEYEGSELGGASRTIQAAIADAKQVASEAIQEEQTARHEADTTITADLAKKAYADGEYTDLHAGTSDQLLASAYTTDEEPYHYRQAPSHAGTREMDEIVGGSVVWNQTVHHLYFNLCTQTTSNGIITITPSDDRNRVIAVPSSGTNTNYTVIEGHKYLQTVTIKSDGTNYAGFQNYLNLNITKKTNSASWVNLSVIDVAIGSGNCAVQVYSPSLTEYQIKDGSFMFFDLTAMLGTTIADHIYSLEQATAGAGVEFFRKYFPEEYYAYDAGTMRSVEGLVSHDMVGFNQWDEEWELGAYSTSDGTKAGSASTIRNANPIRVLPNATYYFKANAGNLRIFFYDSSGNFTETRVITKNNTFVTPNNASYINFHISGTTYKNDICINISDTAKNGTYEPYEKHSYPLDSTVTLRGIPQLVDGQLKWNGDIYPPSGLISRRYSIVDLGTLNWTYTSGSNSRMSAPLQNVKHISTTSSDVINAICGVYSIDSSTNIYNHVQDKIIGHHSGLSQLWVYDTAYTDATAFKQAISGQYLVYELATPTTEQAEPYQELQICSPYGTEEYVSTGIVPVGHYTKYPTDLKSIVEQIADAPSADGTYTLKATVSGGKVTYSWESA